MVHTVIDRQTHGVGVWAIPRVLQVSIPGHPPERLNTVSFPARYVRYPGDGQALRDDTLRRSLDLGLDRCIRVYFTGFVALLDIQGGST